MSLPKHNILLPSGSVSAMEAAAGARGWCVGKHHTCRNMGALPAAQRLLGMESLVLQAEKGSSTAFTGLEKDIFLGSPV